MTGVVVILTPASEAEPATWLAILIGNMKSVTTSDLLGAPQQRGAIRIDPPSTYRPVRKIRTVDAKLDLGPMKMPIQFNVEMRK